jgi:ATP-dependent helicase/nuclease subunit A
MRRTTTFILLNDSQRHALDTRRNLAVRANAGSGKTSVLVERIVQLLARHWDAGTPLSVTAIAAITFTRKAAAELRSRLRDSFVEMAGTSAVEREQLYWTAQSGELARAMIGTIDSFCARILREFGFPDSSADRIEPDFEPLDAYDEAVLKREAIDRVINRLSSFSGADEREKSLADACRWWAVTQGYDALTQYLATLLDHTIDPETIVAAYGDGKSPIQRMEEAWSDLPAVQRLNQDRAELRLTLQKIVNTCESVRKPGKLLGALRDEVRSIVEALNHPAAQPEDANVLRALRGALLNQKGEPRNMRGLAEVQDDLASLQASWQDLLRSFDFDFDGELCAAEAADKLVRLLEPVAHEYLALCHDANHFDFMTIARRTRDLLKRDEAVRRSLQDTYRYVLVDEFQDTNPLQWEIISWIVGDGPEGPLAVDRLFIVGDPQQSIYRFRHADVRVFMRVQALIRAENQRHGLAALATDYDRMIAETGQDGLASDEEQHLGLMPLAENFRSLTPIPLMLVDRVFRHVFDPKQHQLDLARNAFEIQYQPLKPGIANDAVGEVHYVIAGAEDAAEADEETAGPDQAGEATGNELANAQVAAVVDRLVALHGQPKYTAKPGEPQQLDWGDMAVLLPSRSVVLMPLEREFRRRHVPSVVTRGIGFWQRQEVRDVIHLATCLADPGDELAVFAVLRSPIGQLTDAEILFLSELGRGSLRRGLAMLAQGALPVADDADPARQTLSEVWQAFSAEVQGRLRRVAATLDDWRQGVDRLAHADLLQRSLEESGAYAVYAAEPEGAVILANLARLFDQVRGEEERDAPGLARLARRLRARMDEAPNEEQASLATDRNAVQVMTVHAAKGLEFPVVAVLKMDRLAVRPSTGKLMVKTEWDALLPDDAAQLPHCRPGTVAVSVRHPCRPRETYTPRLLQALRNLDRAQQLAESRRLFYVAATRAKERLILAGKPLTKTRVSWQKWFEEALGLTDEHKRNGVWEDAAAGLRVLIHSAVEEVGPIAETAPSLPNEALELEPIHEASAVRAVATTSLEEMRTTWRANRAEWELKYRLHVLPCVETTTRLVGAEDSESAHRPLGTVIGTLVHRLFEMPEVLDQPAAELRRLLEAMTANLLASSVLDNANGEASLPALDPAALHQVVGAVEGVLQRLRDGRPGAESVRRLLTAAGETEVAFALRLGRWHLSGRFDKLLATDGAFEIVDWKTDRDAEIGEIVRRHRPQMKLYALALHRAGRAAPAGRRVRVHLVLLHHLRVRTLTFAPARLEVFAAGLERELDEMTA